ncbi:MAG: hypothetical protein ABFE13_12000 [Phycisphaerales bacterium]
MKDWKLRTRVLDEARNLADHDREPFTVCREGERVFPKPTRKALAMAASPRHPGLVLLQEVEPR